MPIAVIAIGAIALLWIYSEGKKRQAGINPGPSPKTPEYWEHERNLPAGLLDSLIAALNPARLSDREGGLTLMTHQFAFEQNAKLMDTGEKSFWFVHNATLPYSALSEATYNLQIASFSLAESYKEARRDIRDTYLAEARKRGLGAAIADAWFKHYTRRK